MGDPPHPQDEVRTTVLRPLGKIAPETHLAAAKSDVSVRDRQNPDSLGFLHSVIALHQWPRHCLHVIASCNYFH